MNTYLVIDTVNEYYKNHISEAFDFSGHDDIDDSAALEIAGTMVKEKVAKWFQRRFNSNPYGPTKQALGRTKVDGSNIKEHFDTPDGVRHWMLRLEFKREGEYLMSPEFKGVVNIGGPISVGIPRWADEGFREEHPEMYELAKYMREHPEQFEMKTDFIDAAFIHYNFDDENGMCSEVYDTRGGYDLVWYVNVTPINLAK